jgi:hypothetical protein
MLIPENEAFFCAPTNIIISVSKRGVFETEQVLMSRFGKLWTEECVQWRTDARGVRTNKECPDGFVRLITIMPQRGPVSANSQVQWYELEPSGGRPRVPRG